MTTIQGLMNYWPNTIKRMFEAFRLKAEIKREYCNYSFFKWQQQNGQDGMRDSQNRIVNLEAQLRDLESWTLGGSSKNRKNSNFGS